MNNVLSALPTSKESAKISGAKHYVDSTPCRNGHENPIRITNSGLCKECLRLRNARKDPQSVRKHRENTLARFNERVKNDEHFRQSVRARQRKWYVDSQYREKKLKRLAEYRQEELPKAKKRESDRIRYHSVLKHDTSYRESMKQRSAKWAKENSHKRNESTNNRRAMRLRATPKWLTAEDRKVMQGLYAQAKAASLSGVAHEVDHVVPLRSNQVSGLHVPWNLRVIPQSENRSKLNRLVIAQ